MNVIYYTAGSALADGEIRRQCLRIPEVLAILQEAQRGRKSDLISCLALEDEWRKLSTADRAELISVVQQGLFARFCQAQIPHGEVIRRSDYQGPMFVAKELRWMLASAGSISVHVIGPGLDEVPMVLKDHRVEFIDVIENDPALHWFWSEIKRIAHA